VFQKWFQNILPKLEPGSVIVMDDGPYHCVKLDRSPNKTWRKRAITDWLHEKNVSFDENTVKDEVLTKAKSCANANRVMWLRYHCNLNHILLVWSQVKGYIARHNKTFKFRDLFGLVPSALSQITSQRW
jgi:hypothetical protein